MSSHHIVKENQEPALIIANGEACGKELLGQLLEWSPFVVVLDGALHRVLELGIKFDVLLGDFDRLGPNVHDLLQHQQPVEVVHTPDQNKTDLDKGIEFLIQRGFHAIHIIWATGRRADHTITNITNMVKYKSHVKLVMWDDYSRIFPLPARFEKWYTGGTPLSLIPVGEVRGIVTSGLMYNLSGENLTIGIRTGSSNSVLRDGFINISHETGNLLLMECHD